MVTKRKRMGSVPIPYIKFNITIDTMFETNADANVNTNVQCERTLTSRYASSFCTADMFFYLAA